jgi:hypothetical protein
MLRLFFSRRQGLTVVKMTLKAYVIVCNDSFNFFPHVIDFLYTMSLDHGQRIFKTVWVQTECYVFSFIDIRLYLVLSQV